MCLKYQIPYVGDIFIAKFNQEATKKTVKHSMRKIDTLINHFGTEVIELYTQYIHNRNILDITPLNTLQCKTTQKTAKKKKSIELN